ncbi:MAG: DUF1080 domain-containing protein [Flavobacteriales bacterium]|nr:DUF1080 domain-containing protein [Flavobacteriales bacterium]
MNINKYYLIPLFCCALYSCSDEPKEVEQVQEAEQITQLPMQTMALEDLQAFKPEAKNWSVVGSIYADRAKEKTFVSEPGTGILLNTPSERVAKDNLFTVFEHGDIELELDVMMPVGSNSGLYFQSRYEVQLFDSWGKDTVDYDDIGGIYRSYDPEKEVDEFAGAGPKINASKAPGLWQHIRVVFRAPTFDSDGNKKTNALFEKVWLNGVLLHENLEVPCPTASSAFNDETGKASLMIQGDHGPVALKNIEYKIYGSDQLQFSDVAVTEYKQYENNHSRWLPSIDTLTVDSTFTADSVSSLLLNGSAAKMITYKGKMVVSTAGDYLFEMKINWGAGQFIVYKDTLLNLDGDYNAGMPQYAELTLPKGEVPFTVVYSKSRAYQNGFSVSAEGPEIEKHEITAASSLSKGKSRKSPVIELEVADEVVLQRGFVYHKGSKKTHNIFIGLPEQKSIAFDLSSSSLLQVWGGDFVDVAPMWHSRGNDQIGKPLGAVVASYGGPDFAALDNDNSVWPDSIPKSESFKQIGYSIDEKGNPKFQFSIEGSVITNEFESTEGVRSIKRLITASIKKEIWHKVAGGAVIELLPDGSYAIDDKAYYIILSETGSNEAVLRKSGGKDELLIKIPVGESEINYSIIW